VEYSSTTTFNVYAIKTNLHTVNSSQMWGQSQTVIPHSARSTRMGYLHPPVKQCHISLCSTESAASSLQMRWWEGHQRDESQLESERSLTSPWAYVRNTSGIPCITHTNPSPCHVRAARSSATCAKWLNGDIWLGGDMSATGLGDGYFVQLYSYQTTVRHSYGYVM